MLTSLALHAKFGTDENKTKLLMLEAQTNFEQEQFRIEVENKKRLDRQKLELPRVILIE